MNDFVSLEKEYNRLAKKANRRLRDIEALKHTKGFENVEKYAYARAMKDIKSQKINKSENRFKENLKGNENVNTIRAMLNDVETFLNSPTSTKSGIVSTYKKRVETINSNYGLNLNWQQFESFINSKTWENLNKAYGSKTAMKLAGNIQKNKKQILKDIEKGKDISIKVEDWKLQSTLDELLKNNEISIDDLFVTSRRVKNAKTK